MFELAQRIYNLLDELRQDENKTYLLVAHNGIARVVESYFHDMTNEEYSAAGSKTVSWWNTGSNNSKKAIGRSRWPFFSTGCFAIVENFVLGDEHQYRDAERTGLGCRDGQPDALDAQNHGQEDEGQQLE